MSNGSRKFQVNIPEHLRAPINANIIRVTTTIHGEVIMDFVFSHPQDVDSNGNQLGTLVARIVVPTPTARDLLVILEQHLGKTKKE